MYDDAHFHGEYDARQHKDGTDMRTDPQCSEPRRLVGFFSEAEF
jgi:hypothetical protein